MMLDFILFARQDPNIEGAVRITDQASQLGGNVFIVTLVS